MIQTEPTPNPDSLKFISENTISAVGTEEFQKNKMNEISNSFIKELLDFNPNYKIQPPLRGAEDQKALRQGLLDGTIDMVTCLHQPINPELKDLDFVNSEPGSIGLEAAFKVLQNHFPLEKVISFLTRGKKRFGIIDQGFKLGASADFTIFTPYGSGNLSVDELSSSSKNCMFIGSPTKGFVYGCIRKEKLHLNS